MRIIITLTLEQLNQLNPELYSAIKNVVRTYPSQSIIEEAIQTIRANNIIHGEDLATITQEPDGDILGFDRLVKLKPDWYQSLKGVTNQEKALDAALKRLENVPNLNNLSVEENSGALSALGVRVDFVNQGHIHDAFGGWNCSAPAALLGDDYALDVAGAANSIEG